MNTYREILIDLAWRSVLAYLILKFGLLLLVKIPSIGPLLPIYFLTLLLISAAIVSPPIASLIAKPFGNIFSPDKRFDGPQPLYSIPESKRIKGLAQEAFNDFQSIAEKYPQELKAYIQMIDIAIVDMKNAELAQSVLNQALDTIKREKDRDTLTQMYEAISSRLETLAE